AALKAKPEDISVLRSAGGFYWRYNQLALAEPLLAKMLDPQVQASKSDQLWARRGLALRWATSGEHQQDLKARQAIERNIKEGGTVEDLRAKATILSTRPGQQLEAVRILEGLRGRESSSPEQELILAELYEKTRKWPMAKEIYTNLAVQSSS